MISLKKSRALLVPKASSLILILLSIRSWVVRMQQIWFSLRMAAASLMGADDLPLILDEPFSGLDPVNSDLFKSIIREVIDAGKYLIMSSHQMAAVEEFCTDITIMDKSRTVLRGNLNEIKKSYGRVNLYLKTEQDASALINSHGVQLLSRKENEYHCKVSGDAQANALLADLIQDKVTVIAFDLREPSLHEILIEKAGGADAQE